MPIQNDPNLEQPPDFASAAFAASIQSISQAQNIPAVEAIQQLVNAWTAAHEERVQQWNQEEQQQQQQEEEQQQQQQQQQQEEQQQQQDEQQRQEQEQQRQIEEDEARRDEESAGRGKSRAKMHNFETRKLVPDVLDHRPSRYALTKLKDCKYVELYYFTPQACRDATLHDRTVAQGSLTLTHINETVALKPVAAFKASSKAVPDEHLSFADFSVAKASMMTWITKFGWPQKHVLSLATFYMKIENHPLRRQTDGNSTLLHYQAQIRREWHDAIKPTSVTEPFDIGEINETRLRLIGNDLFNEQRSKALTRLDFFMNFIHPSY